jgi:hypothetical protein
LVEDVKRDGIKAYRITLAGRQAIEKLGELPTPKDKASCRNSRYLPRGPLGESSDEIEKPEIAPQAPPVVSAVEGRVLLRLHKVKERKPALVRAKKQTVWAATGRLVCEVCDFDFAAVYGELGSGFAECHHNQPLAEAAAERLTTLADLAVVCANCHRMLHRRPWRAVGELRELVHSRRAGKHAEPSAAAEPGGR